MDGSEFQMGLGGIARRVSLTVAASAALMAGLHYAPLRGFSPSEMLFGHPERTAQQAPEPKPNIRFVAIPAREAFPPVAGPAAKPVVVPPAAEAEVVAAVPIPTPRPVLTADAAPAMTAVAPARQVRPTPRPRGAAAAVAEPPTVPEMRVANVRTAELMPLDRRDLAQPPVREIGADAELVPEPPQADRRFRLHDLVPSRRGMLRGVVAVGDTVGDGARFAVAGIADGARAIVGR